MVNKKELVEIKNRITKYSREELNNKVKDTSQEIEKREQIAEKRLNILLDQGKQFNIQSMGVLRKKNKKAVERNNSRNSKHFPQIKNMICQIEQVH